MRSARVHYADHALYYYNNIENEQTKDRLDEVPDPSLEVEDLRNSLFSAKIERSWSCW